LAWLLKVHLLAIERVTRRLVEMGAHDVDVQIP
jgi:hypothetical protein